MTKYSGFYIGFSYPVFRLPGSNNGAILGEFEKINKVINSNFERFS